MKTIINNVNRACATISKKDGEYIVRFRDARGMILHEATYYTDSLEDAEGTALLEVERMAEEV